jgi:uncharacterized protein
MNIEDIFQTVRLNNFMDLQEILKTTNVNIENESKQNLLHEAAAFGSIECTLELLNHGIDTNHQDNKGQSPLHYCAANRTNTIAEYLLKKGASLSIEDNYSNQPLWTAVFNARGEYELVRLFIINGADPNHKNKNGKSPLDFAIQINDKKLEESLQIKK